MALCKPDDQLALGCYQGAARHDQTRFGLLGLQIPWNL
jgi:hypothetical protein